MPLLPPSLKLRSLLAVALTAPLLLAGCAHRAVVVYQAPPSWSRIQHQGFDDGLKAAREDIRHGRPPSFDQHPRFRNPPVPPPAWAEYRAGFREGYERALHPGR